MAESGPTIQSPFPNRFLPNLYLPLLYTLCIDPHPWAVLTIKMIKRTQNSFLC